MLCSELDRSGQTDPLLCLSALSIALVQSANRTNEEIEVRSREREKEAPIALGERETKRANFASESSLQKRH